MILVWTAMVTKRNSLGSGHMEWETSMRPMMSTASPRKWQVHCDEQCNVSLWDCSVIILPFTLSLPILSDTGSVFYTATAEKFTFSEAVVACSKQGAQLANTGQLYLAWQGGMDVCNAGWLGDRSVRYPINIRRPQCGGGLLGVRTVYLYTNQTGYPLPESRYDAFCYTGRPSLSLVKGSYTKRFATIEKCCYLR